MNSILSNPFNITKAVDFTDEQILQTWVDWPGSGGFLGVVQPASPMPMLLLGGKGSGRTHLMRYLSYPVQKLRYKAGVASGVRESGYLGVFYRCGGLEAGRFAHKGVADDQWQDLFAYMLDVSLLRLLLLTVSDLCLTSGAPVAHESDLAREIGSLAGWDGCTSINALTRQLANVLREIDVEVSNAALARRVNVKILAGRGRLIFEPAQILARRIPQLGRCTLTFLLDEFENFSAPQQKYVNTLLRERQAPVTFKIGARQHGIRTHETFSGGEENREGAEFELIHLDRYLRDQGERYHEFARAVVRTRIITAGLQPASRSTEDILAALLQAPLGRREELQFLTAAATAYDEGRPPHLQRLRTQLRDDASRVTVADIDFVIDAVTDRSNVLVEKANLLLFYREWAAGRPPRAAADAVLTARGMPTLRRPQVKLLRHFGADLKAQLRRELRVPKFEYVGFDTYIRMSSGRPRNLLMILKYIFRYALFIGEDVASFPITRESQRRGVEQAANWFFDDATAIGENSSATQVALERFARFLAELRYADRIPEPSPVAVSFAFDAPTPAASAVLRDAEQSGLIVVIEEGQKHKSLERVDAKIQLSPMVAPRFLLPVHRRGTIPLGSDEVNAIFDPKVGDNAFARTLKARSDRANAPFRAPLPAHPTLPGV